MIFTCQIKKTRNLYVSYNSMEIQLLYKTRLLLFINHGIIQWQVIWLLGPGGIYLLNVYGEPPSISGRLHRDGAAATALSSVGVFGGTRWI